MVYIARESICLNFLKFNLSNFYLGCEATLLNEVVKELPTGHMFQHQVLEGRFVFQICICICTDQVFPIFVDVVKTKHILMFNQLHYCDLSLDLKLQFRIVDILCLIFLYK